jgi:bifunctional non-homologous end joining protein LigD
VSGGETRDGVSLTNLAQPLFDGADATKRDLVDYLDVVRGQFIPVLWDRPLSVVRVLRGQPPFMQKNVPRYAPSWVRTVRVWAEASRREVSYALCDDRRTLLWLANQRAVEFHPALVMAGDWQHPTHLVLDIDPPEGGNALGLAVHAAQLAHQVLAEAGLAGVVKTSGAKGVHVFVPVDAGTSGEGAAAATRAIAVRAERLDPALATTAFIREDRGGKVFLDSTRAGGSTVVAVYIPQVRPGAPVSFPVPWDALDPCRSRGLQRSQCGAADHRRRSVGGADARAAVPGPRPGRGGAHDPGRPGARHARREAPRPRPPRRGEVTEGSRADGTSLFPGTSINWRTGKGPAGQGPPGTGRR